MSDLTKRNAGAYKNVSTVKPQDTVYSDTMGQKPMLDFTTNTAKGPGIMKNDLGSDTSIGGAPKVKGGLNSEHSAGEDIGGFGNPPTGANKRKQGKSDVTNVVRK